MFGLYSRKNDPLIGKTVAEITQMNPSPLPFNDVSFITLVYSDDHFGTVTWQSEIPPTAVYDGRRLWGDEVVFKMPGA